MLFDGLICKFSSYFLPAGLIGGRTLFERFSNIESYFSVILLLFWFEANSDYFVYPELLLLRPSYLLR